MVEFIYILELTGFEPTLTKIGMTANAVDRIKHHKTSMNAWEVLHMVPLNSRAVGGAREGERFLKRLYRRHRYRNSPEIFLLPYTERFFLEHLSPAFFRYQVYNLITDDDDFLEMHLDERFEFMARANGMNRIVCLPGLEQTPPVVSFEEWQAMHREGHSLASAAKALNSSPRLDTAAAH
jgi:hypothetical protein